MQSFLLVQKSQEPIKVFIDVMVIGLIFICAFYTIFIFLVLSVTFYPP